MSDHNHASGAEIQTGACPDTAPDEPAGCLRIRGPLSVLVALLALTAGGPAQAEDVYKAPKTFLAESFGDEVPEPEALWITGPLRAAAADILGHPYPGLRVRYWSDAARTAWILEEVGKERPITTGIVIADDAIERMEVLIYRESRGWEVRYPYFTDQFIGARLADDSTLSDRIDGISGATLSVRAMRNMARLALYFHNHLQDKDTSR